MLKRYAIILLVALLAQLSVSGKGKFTWLESEHDFGTFAESEDRVVCTFRAVNTGDAPATIVRVMPTCGCTTGEYTQTPVAVGDTATVTLTYHAIGRVGSFNKSAYVYSDTEQRKYVLRISGNVLASKETVEEMYPYHIGSLYFDRRAIPFGEAKKGAAKMGYIGAYNNSADTIRVTFENAPKFAELEAFPAVVPPFALCTISGYFESEHCDEWGPVTAEITVAVTDKQGTERMPVDVAAIISEDFSKLSKKDLEKAPIARLSDEVIDFGEITPSNGVIRREVILSYVGGTKMHLRRVYSTDAAVGVHAEASEVKPGATCKVSVAVNAAKVSGDYLNARLTVITNDPSRPTQEVRLVGIVKRE